SAPDAAPEEPLSEPPPAAPRELAPPTRELAAPPWRDLPELPSVRFDREFSDGPPDDQRRGEPTAPVVALPFDPTAAVGLAHDRARLLRLAAIVAIATAFGALLMSALC
ncbi:MAG: hypothetical protein K8W52_18980, partial [Deltaproteobacteria bacterium]|nr:hypothetical protein [Deltaproteobacteria bacterium]